jgi:hypothetical protein
MDRNGSFGRQGHRLDSSLDARNDTSPHEPVWSSLSTMRTPGILAISALAFGSLIFTGCTTMASVNLSDTACSATFETQLTSILVHEKEKPDVADKLSQQTYRMLTMVDYGPRPFLVSSPSGTDYTFFMEKKGKRCLLRLYGRQHGFMSYTNNLTYIATRELTGCACQE